METENIAVTADRVETGAIDLQTQIDKFGKDVLAAIDKLQKQRDALESRLLRIHLLCCYCTEEDTNARYACLLEIGKIARGEVSSAMAHPHG